MIISETGIYIGIVIMGAMIVAVAAFLVMKSTSKKGIAQIEKHPVNPVDNLEASATTGKRHASILGPALNKLRSLLKTVPRERSQRKRDVAPDQQPIGEEPTIRERFSTPSPGVTSSEPEINAVPFSPDQQPIGEEPTIRERLSTPLPGITSSEPEINAVPSSPDQWAPNMEPANEEELEVNTLSILPAESAESGQGLPEEKPEELPEASDNEYQQQKPETKGSMLDLFTTEVVEESDVSQLAAKLSDIDIHDLSEEAQELINQLKGAKK